MRQELYIDEKYYELPSRIGLTNINYWIRRLEICEELKFPKDAAISWLAPPHDEKARQEIIRKLECAYNRWMKMGKIRRFFKV